jgi:ATP-dependent Clp protease ATP-binding subunit ClpA
MIVKRVSDLDIYHRGFITAIKGNTDDSFVDEGLCTYTFDQQLYLYLKNEGYDRVYYYTRASGYNWYSFDKESLTSLFPEDAGNAVNDGRPLGGGRLRRTATTEGIPKHIKKGIINHREYYYVSNFEDSTLVKTVQDILKDTQKKSVIYFTSPVFSINEAQGFVAGIAQIMSEVAAEQSENKLLIKYNSNGVFKADFFNELVGASENVFSVGSPDRKECENWLNLRRIEGKIDSRQVYGFPYTKLIDQLYNKYIKILTMDKGLKHNKISFVDSLRVEDFSEELLVRSLSRIHGQQDNVDLIVKKVTTWINRPDESKTPLVFMFAGTSGTGKTYTAETISNTLVSHGYRFVKLPMNEYKSSGDSWKLLGSPQGYIGSDTDTPLIAAYRQSKKLVILFDEMEKAHESIFETIMTLMEKGEITNGQGELFDFRQSIIIFTTNLAMSQLLEKKAELRKTGTSIDSYHFQQSIKETLIQNGVKPEICGRINDVLVYNTLNKEVVAKIAIEEIRKLGFVYRLQINNISQELLHEIATQVAESKLGARPIKEIITDKLEKVFQQHNNNNGKVKNRANNGSVDCVVDIGANNNLIDVNPDQPLQADEIISQYPELFKEKKVVSFDRNKLANDLQSVKGQQDNMEIVVDAVTTWIRRKRKSKPLVLMFAGTSGTGKTFTAKNIQKSLAEDGYKFVRLNMNEYHSEADSWKLLGSATGHVGSDNDAPIFAARKMSDKLVILFDEIEKAHPSLFTTIMGLMDEGMLADGRGVNYDFRQSVVIFTTNLAMNKLLEAKNNLKSAGVPINSNEFQEVTKEILKNNKMPNEICGRIDWLLVYNTLDATDVAQIAIEQIRAKGMEYELNINSVSEEYLMKISEQCSDSNEGARPIKREIDRTIEPILQDAYESGEYSPNIMYDLDEKMRLVESSNI